MPWLVAFQAGLSLTGLAFDPLFALVTDYGLTTGSVWTPHHVRTLIHLLRNAELLQVVELWLSQDILDIIVVYRRDSTDASEIVNDHLALYLTYKMLL